jgi:thiamine transporter ThiT
MSEVVWSMHDILLTVLCLIVIVGLIVLDFLYCTQFKGGFCVVRWWLNYLITAACNGTTNIFAKGLLYGLLRMVDLIPI